MRAVIIGTGKVGFAIIGALADERADVVAIDLDEKSLEKATELFDIQTIHGSGALPANLKNAGIESAEMMVAVTNSDEVNMVACSIAAMKAPHAIRVARIRDAGFLQDDAILGKDGFGVTHAINPEQVAAKRIDEILNIPVACDVAELHGDLKLIGIRVPGDSPVSKATIEGLRSKVLDLPMLITTIIRDGQSMVPSGKDKILPGDILYVVITIDNFKKLAEVIGKPWRIPKRVIIAGGTGIGQLLAKRIEKNSRLNIKLIESDSQKAHELAEHFSKILVLQGSATDENLLLEENIKDCDVFVAALQDEEANVMAALNAKRYGAHKVIALTDKTGYIPIIENAGVDTVVSPQALAIGTILHHMHQGKVKSITPFSQNGQTQVTQFEALDTAKVVGKELKSVKLPPNSIIGLLVRDGVPIIPRGHNIIQPGDKVFAFAQKNAMKQLEKLFTVSFDFF